MKWYWINIGLGLYGFEVNAMAENIAGEYYLKYKFLLKIAVVILKHPIYLFKDQLIRKINFFKIKLPYALGCLRTEGYKVKWVHRVKKLARTLAVLWTSTSATCKSIILHHNPI